MCYDDSDFGDVMIERPSKKRVRFDERRLKFLRDAHVARCAGIAKMKAEMKSVVEENDDLRRKSAVDNATINELSEIIKEKNEKIIRLENDLVSSHYNIFNAEKGMENAQKTVDQMSFVWKKVFRSCVKYGMMHANELLIHDETGITYLNEEEMDVHEVTRMIMSSAGKDDIPLMSVR